MSKGSSSPPPPPDPYRVAGAQTQQNRDTAEYNAALNRVNTYTPFGSQEYNVTGNDPRTGAPIYEQRINLSPEQQQLYDQQMQQNYRLGELGGNVIDHLTGQPIDTSGLPALRGGFDLGGNVQSSFNQYGPQMSLETGDLPGLPTDLSSFRNEAEGALYDRNTAYLDQDFGRREDALRTRLANQGIVEGSEAYKNAVDDFERGREMSYRQARNESIAGGGMEASRMFDIASRGRGQLYGEALGSGEFANRAAGQATGQSMAAAGFGNDARRQMLAEMLAGNDQSNRARAQGLSEQLALRNQPLNEFNAYRSAGQIQMPQFQGMSQVNTNPADIAGAMNNQYQGQLDIYNANQQGRNNFMGGLFGLGAAALSNPSSTFLLSDENAKDDITPIGELNDGTHLYSYRYKGDDTPQVGVIAQEVEKRDPSAVKMGRDGLRRVNYSKVLANALEAA